MAPKHLCCWHVQFPAQARHNEMAGTGDKDALTWAGQKSLLSTRFLLLVPTLSTEGFSSKNHTNLSDKCEGTAAAQLREAP